MKRGLTSHSQLRLRAVSLPATRASLVEAMTSP
jgi:hypothetical protein